MWTASRTCETACVLDRFSTVLFSQPRLLVSTRICVTLSRYRVNCRVRKTVIILLQLKTSSNLSCHGAHSAIRSYDLRALYKSVYYYYFYPTSTKHKLSCWWHGYLHIWLPTSSECSPHRWVGRHRQKWLSLLLGQRLLLASSWESQQVLAGGCHL